MGDPAAPAWMATAARKWLEDAGAIAEDGAGAGDGRRAFNALPLFGVRVSLAERGRAVCSLRVPAHLTDADGNWHAGAIAAAVDDVCAAAIMSVEGIIKVSVHYDISYFAPAKHHVEVEMDGRVVDRKGRMTGGDDGGPEGVRRAGGDRPAVDDHLQTNGISRKQAMIQQQQR